MSRLSKALGGISDAFGGVLGSVGSLAMGAIGALTSMFSAPKLPIAPPPFQPLLTQDPKNPDSALTASQRYKKKKDQNALNANSTLLTGSAGIDPSLLNLGKTTLLGG